MNYLWHSIKNTFNFKGRASQREFICFCILYFSLKVFPIFIGVIANAPILFILGIICSIILFIPNISIIIRRCHDIGDSAKYYLMLFCLYHLSLLFPNFFQVYHYIADILFKIAYFLLSLTQYTAPQDWGYKILYYVIYNPLECIYFGLWIYLAYKEGSTYKNEYGEPPHYS